ncbi:PstA family ABC transporter permease [Thermoflavifilum thermophilum]|nr:ABC transporter permease subunit [Thermoflavifilum thermophilum]
MKSIMAITTYSIILVFIYLILVISWKGIPALSWEMISEIPSGGFYFGKEGGILNAIIGSIYLSVGATFLSLLISIPIALYLNIHLLHHNRIKGGIRYLLDILWGIPSILYGAFGFILMIVFHLQASLLAGIITLALLITPIIIRAFDEALQGIPEGLLEASYAMGLTRNQIAFHIFVRQAMPGLITATLIGFGRAIGDAASVLFTTGYTDHIPTSLDDPTASLPLAIFFQLSSPIPEVRERAYAAAFILTLIILAISLLIRLCTSRLSKYQI